MVVQDIIDIVKYSELNNLAIKNDVNAIVTFMNMGILELYKRFPLKVEEHIVPLQDGVTIYDLPSDFMYPLEAFGEVHEFATDKKPPIVPFNDADDPTSIFFPNFTQVQIPLVTTGSFISLIYVSKPARIDADDLSSEISIPETLVEALVYYIGFRAHTSIKSDGQSENNIHWVRFDQSCKKARELGVAYPMDSWKMNDRLSNRGFA
jgi:hypothetical protein